MSRYDRFNRYDSGWRREPQDRPPAVRRTYPRHRYASQFDERYEFRDWHPSPRFDERRDPIGRMRNRVTAPYNMDYIVGYREDPRRRNYNPYTGDRPDRIGDASYYQQPYMTIGGTRTYRGAPRPMRYDRYDYF